MGESAAAVAEVEQVAAAAAAPPAVVEPPRPSWFRSEVEKKMRGVDRAKDLARRTARERREAQKAYNARIKQENEVRTRTPKAQAEGEVEA